MEEFLEILRTWDIEVLVDVRRYPGSKRSPHFKKENLMDSMALHKIKYYHIEDLGGRRKAGKNSANTAWRLLSFRGYADYMETETFQAAAKKLQEIAVNSSVAYMCAETVWWSCHRALISDYLKVRGWKVNHIMGPEKIMEHPWTRPAEIVDGKLTYRKKNPEKPD
ncbi:DUF488 domain-containing protein [Salinimicrobium marinum]|nr:DUF488 domain-containing protein [Salinimicrobium marinum]